MMSNLDCAINFDRIIMSIIFFSDSEKIKCLINLVTCLIIQFEQTEVMNDCNSAVNAIEMIETLFSNHFDYIE